MNRRQFLKLAGALLIRRPDPVVACLVERPTCRCRRRRTGLRSDHKKCDQGARRNRPIREGGHTVVVKPNMGWDRKPEQAATTHPAVVKGIVEECLKAGAKRVKVFDNPCNDMRRCYENSGIPAALKDLKNVEVKYMEEERYKKVNLKGVFLKEWELYGEALRPTSSSTSPLQSTIPLPA